MPRKAEIPNSLLSLEDIQMWDRGRVYSTVKERPYQALEISPDTFISYAYFKGI